MRHSLNCLAIKNISSGGSVYVTRANGNVFQANENFQLDASDLVQVGKKTTCEISAQDADDIKVKPAVKIESTDSNVVVRFYFPRCQSVSRVANQPLYSAVVGVKRKKGKNGTEPTVQLTHISKVLFSAPAPASARKAAAKPAAAKA